MKPSLGEHFGNLYRADPDPWGCDTRWYEQRKRALLLASLPRPRYRRAYEPACGNGALTAELARRCDSLVASDGCEEAFRLTRARMAGRPNVQVCHQLLPEGWRTSAAGYDLIVVSEVGYYLDAAALARVASCIGQSLAPAGDLVACHWRRSPGDFEHTAEEVHEVLGRIGLVHGLARHIEEDFILDVWSRDARAVAVREDAP